MDNTVTIQIIIGSTRPGRFSERPAHYLFSALAQVEGVRAELIDLRDWPLPFFNAPMPPTAMHGNYPDELVQRWSEKIKEADAFIVIAPEYNHGYSAVLKNAMDWLMPEWHHKPVGFVSYGSALGSRAIEQLRQVVIELGMHPIKPSIHIPTDIIITHRTKKDPAPTNEELFQPLREGRTGDVVKRFFDELIDLTRTLKAGRKALHG
jgi:NAD(P)H-dependent FMN reductase